MKKLIGIVGLKKKDLLNLMHKYKSCGFISIDDNNIFNSKSLKIDALIVLYEYPVKNTLSVFLKKKFKNFKNLRWVHLTRAGIDEFEPYLKQYKFKFTAGKKIQGPNVSEHCLALLLSLTRGLYDQLNFTKYSYRPTEIQNKKILIVGLGGIGLSIAKKLNSFETIIDSVDHSFKKKKYINKNFSIDELKKIISNYDIVINSLPLTKNTNKIFNDSIFKNMKQESIFISVSRDQTINLKDLKFHIKKKKFFGVGIDNTGSFKMKNKIQYNKNFNFLITDHLAGVTTDNSRRIKLIYDNIESYLKNKKVKYSVSKIKGY